MVELFEVNIEHASDPELLTAMLAELELMSKNTVYRRDVLVGDKHYRFVTEDPECDNNLGLLSDRGRHLLCEVFEREYKAGRPLEFSFFSRSKEGSPIVYLIGTALHRDIIEFNMLRL